MISRDNRMIRHMKDKWLVQQELLLEILVPIISFRMVTGGWNGLFIYESGRNPSIGDSVIITGEIDEYYGKTEMTNITDYYFISGNNTLPDPVVVQTGNVDRRLRKCAGESK